jgi:type II secretory pathway pseudopilin PulG
MGVGPTLQRKKSGSGLVLPQSCPVDRSANTTDSSRKSASRFLPFPSYGRLSDHGSGRCGENRDADFREEYRPNTHFAELQYRQRRTPSGFSLGELLAVVIIGSMILAAILTIYGRVSQAADGVLRKIDSPAWAQEVLQLMARDLSRIMNEEDATVQVRNGLDNGFHRAELILRRTYHDSEHREQTLEQITWRAGYDHEGGAPGLVLYRSYEGLAREDKLLDDNREQWEQGYPFVPICRGLTFFQIQACKGKDLVDQWPPSVPPAGVKITISFGEPHELVGGGYDVADYEKISRTVAIDPTRDIKFTMLVRREPNGVADPNALPDGTQPTPEQATDGLSSRGQRTNERTTNERMPARFRSR